jgi:hypothetical protein
MMFRAVFWVVTRQYNPEDSSEQELCPSPPWRLHGGSGTVLLSTDHELIPTGRNRP